MSLNDTIQQQLHSLRKDTLSLAREIERRGEGQHDRAVHGIADGFRAVAWATYVLSQDVKTTKTLESLLPAFKAACDLAEDQAKVCQQVSKPVSLRSLIHCAIHNTDIVDGIRADSRQEFAGIAGEFRSMMFKIKPPPAEGPLSTQKYQSSITILSKE